MSINEVSVARKAWHVILAKVGTYATAVPTALQIASISDTSLRLG
ncbi:MAG: hypothetical protein R3E08_11810 [Thiotrichaceae bacterium]